MRGVLSPGHSTVSFDNGRCGRDGYLSGHRRTVHRGHRSSWLGLTQWTTEMQTLVWSRGLKGFLANFGLVAAIGLVLFTALTLGVYPLVEYLAQ